MSRTIRSIFCVLMAAMSLGSVAQNNTSSPFSCMGYGDINDNVPTAYRGMGGVGLGMRSRKAICPAQPASYTACDSLTFMFDMAGSVMWTRYQDDVGMRNKANGNLEYLTLQFPLYKRWVAFSAGLLPYSSVGYDLHMVDSINSDYHYTMNYYGNGGISEVYGGLSVNLFNWVAAGFNCYYLFGDVVNTRSVLFVESGPTAILQASSTTVSSVRFREGLQLFHEFDNHSFVLGAIFENQRKMNGKAMVAESSQLDTVWVLNDLGQTPMMWGIGASYCWKNNLTITFDYSCAYWSKVYQDARLKNIMDPLRDRNRYAFGMEYRHNPMGRNYAQRMYWRLGAQVADSYIEAMSAPDFLVSMGLGFPLRNAGTVFNMSVEYGHRGQIASLKEDYMRLTISAAICENWFFKRKL